MNAGLGIVRRSGHVYQERFRLVPAQRWQETVGAARDEESLELHLPYHPPYCWPQIVAYLQPRAIPGVESVTQEGYRRTLSCRKGHAVHHGWISVSHVPRRSALRLTLSAALLPVLPQVMVRIRHLFDLDRDPVAAHRRLLERYGLPRDLPVHGMRLPGCIDPFEVAVAAALGQQAGASSAADLAGRLCAALGVTVATPFADLCACFPASKSIAALEARDLEVLGIPAARARAVHALAHAMDTGAVTLSPAGNLGRELDTLLGLPGFDPWKVQYIAMRVLGWGDLALETDAEVREALCGAAGTEKPGMTGGSNAARRRE